MSLQIHVNNLLVVQIVSVRLIMKELYVLAVEAIMAHHLDVA